MLWTGPVLADASADSAAPLRQQMQDLQRQIQQQKHQIQSQQQQIQKLEKRVHSRNNKKSGESSTTEVATTSANKKKQKPKKSLHIGGILTEQYQIKNKQQNNATGGNTTQGVFAINAHGRYKNLTFGLEQRFSQNSFADTTFLRYGWAALSFGTNDNQQVKAGLFQVPFGNLRYGYQTFWGNLGYFAGFTDNQAAGVGYKYESGGWRFDLDFFKDDDLGQHSLYGSNPFEGYNQLNGGNARIAYTFNKGHDNNVQVSVAGRGGQLAVGGNNANGTHWAGTAAIDAKLGQWTLQGQFVDYKYNIPDGKTTDDNSALGEGTQVLPSDSITVENYGFGYQIPSEGQLYTANIARTFPLDIGPISNIQFYNNYGYLHAGSGDYDSRGNRIGDVQFNAAGFVLSSGPLLFYFDVLSGKNAAMAFNGGNDGDWHTRYNFAIGLYFGGDVLSN
ncbi:hypothetical protein HKX42_04270 [Salinisphaera sp. USBA-960]|uniref:hypothetical protein n=1 Tax=Salinisphaera orenii TaxID=856731 RepID=UPI001475EE6B|nr:hypothetical protein [Salifodinibacter halophilus]